MKVALIAHTCDAALLCGEAAAICTNSRNPASALRHAMQSGHTSVLEHAVFTFRIEGLSRAALAQLTRHRIASFDVQSQRYVKLDNPEMVVPDTVRNSEFYAEACELMEKSMNLYKRMLEGNIPCEDARYITMQAVPTALIVTMNVRELLHFFSLRCCNRAQWEIRHLADEMLKICIHVAPTLFDDAGPGCVTGKCPEKWPCGHPRQEGEWNE